MKKLILFSILTLFLACLFSSCKTLERWKNEPLQRSAPAKWKKKTDGLRKAGKRINPLYYPKKRNYLFT